MRNRFILGFFAGTVVCLTVLGFGLYSQTKTQITLKKSLEEAKVENIILNYSNQQLKEEFIRVKTQVDIMGKEIELAKWTHDTTATDDAKNQRRMGR
jgi:hypothetical protein